MKKWHLQYVKKSFIYVTYNLDCKLEMCFNAEKLEYSHCEW